MAPEPGRERKEGSGTVRGGFPGQMLLKKKTGRDRQNWWGGTG